MFFVERCHPGPQGDRGICREGEKLPSGLLVQEKQSLCATRGCVSCKPVTGNRDFVLKLWNLCFEALKLIWAASTIWCLVLSTVQLTWTCPWWVALSTADNLFWLSQFHLLAVCCRAPGKARLFKCIGYKDLLLWHQSLGVSAPFAPLLVGWTAKVWGQKVEIAELNPKWSRLGISAGLGHCLFSCLSQPRKVLEQSILSCLHLPARQIFIFCSQELYFLEGGMFLFIQGKIIIAYRTESKWECLYSARKLIKPFRAISEM